MKKRIVHLMAALGIAMAVISGDVVYCDGDCVIDAGMKCDAHSCGLESSSSSAAWSNNSPIRHESGLGNDAYGCVCAGSLPRCGGTRRLNGTIPRYDNPVACNTVQSGYLSLMAYTGHHLGCTTINIVAEDTTARASQPSI